MAFLLLRGSDQNKYRSMIKGLAQHFSLRNDQYPKTIIAATDVLSTHKIDQKYFDNQKKAREKSRSTESRSESNEEKTMETSFNQTNLYVCCGCDIRASISRPVILCL